MVWEKAKVVYLESDKIRSIIGVVEDIGWAYRVRNEKNPQEWVSINKQYVIKIIKNSKYEEVVKT